MTNHIALAGGGGRYGHRTRRSAGRAAAPSVAVVRLCRAVWWRCLPSICCC